MSKTPADRTELLRLMADAAWEHHRGQRATPYWRATSGYLDLQNQIDAALRAMQAPGYPVTPMQVTEDATWDAFVSAARAWAEHLDQWDRFKFQTSCGPVYVTISRVTAYPDSFDELPDAAP